MSVEAEKKNLVKIIFIYLFNSGFKRDILISTRKETNKFFIYFLLILNYILEKYFNKVSDLIINYKPVCNTNNSN